MNTSLCILDEHPKELLFALNEDISGIYFPHFVSMNCNSQEQTSILFLSIYPCFYQKEKDKGE